jgi:competence protein ComEC
LWAYGLLAALGLLAGIALRRRTALYLPARRHGALWLLAAGVLAFACTGIRSVVFDCRTLDPALEGRDLRVVGVVIDMPQRNESGLRFTFAAESTTLDGRTVVVPPLIDVGWFSSLPAAGNDLLAGQSQPSEVKAGERWSLTLRTKAPHGSRNPFGFDYELWLWERGVQATAYVRIGARDAAPQRLEQTWTHPVALLRQSVRERIVAALPQRQVAGMVAALVVGG